MYWFIANPILTRILLSAVVLVLGIIIGWVSNGWRLNASIASLKASHAEAHSMVLQETRNREKSLLEASERLRKDRDAKVKDLNSRLKSVNAELQHRKERDSSKSTDTAACSGATGAELSKQDAEFLAREAARADEVVVQLNYCIAQYNKLKNVH